MSLKNTVKDKVPVLGSVPMMGKLFQTENTTTNEILVFVTANLIDPAGNRVHNDDELLHFQESSHFQIKAAPDAFPTGGGRGLGGF
jgi:type II secretory pathway component GspD/PulD (secretin)